MAHKHVILAITSEGIHIHCGPFDDYGVAKQSLPKDKLVGLEAEWVTYWIGFIKDEEETHKAATG